MTLDSLFRSLGLPKAGLSFSAWMIGIFVLISPIATVFSIRILGTLPIVFALAIGVGQIVERRKILLPEPTIIWSLSSIFLLAMMSLFWIPLHEYVLLRMVKLFVMFSSIFVILGVVDRLSSPDYRAIMKSGLIGLCSGFMLLAFEVISHNALFNWLVRESDPEIWRVNRPLVIHGIIIWAVLGYLFTFQRYRWPLWIATVLIFLAVALSSTSQSAVIAIVGGAVVWLIASFAPRVALLGVSAAAIAIVALGPWMVEIALLNREVFETGFFTSASAIPRLLIWQDVARIIAEHPFLGTGLESTRVLSFFGAPPGDLGATVGANHPHNAALQIRVEFGVLGLSLTAALFTALTIRLLKLPPDQMRVAASTLAAIVAVSVVSHGMWQSWWLGTILLAVVVAKAYCRSSDERDASPVSQTQRHRHSYDASSS